MSFDLCTTHTQKIQQILNIAILQVWALLGEEDVYIAL